MKTLFENCTVYVNDINKTVLSGAYVSVEVKLISYVGIDKPEDKFDIIKNLNGNILMPGLFNCHTHSPMVLLRGIGSDLPLDKWLFDTVFPIEDRLIGEDIDAGTDLALMEMLSSGTVSFSDMYFFPERTCDKVIAAGMKANISRPVQCFDPEEKPFDSYRIKEASALYDAYHGKADGKLLIDFCIHAEYTCDEKTTAYFSEICNAKHGNMHIHLSETQSEHDNCIKKYGKTPAQWFDDLGAFDSGCFAAHCVALTDGDIEIFKKRDVSVVHNPTSNMKLGSGFADIQRYIDEGINVAIGTDGAASNNNLDLLEEMHLASVIHNGYKREATIMKAKDIIDLATVNGAKLQRRENCGRIQPGYHADLVVLDRSKPHMRPCLDVPALIVYSAQGSDVIMTVCDGEILYENGEYMTIDAEKTYYNFDKSVERLYGTRG